MKWKPKKNQKYYVPLIFFPYNNEMTWENTPTDNDYYNSYLCYETQKEAIDKASMVQAALRGELVRKEDVIKALKAIKYTGLSGDMENGYIIAIEDTIKTVEEL